MDYSHSKLDVARKCMLCFKYKYIDKLKDKQESTASEFGNLVHSISEEYSGGGKEVLLKLYHKYKDKYKISDEYKKKIPLALKNIHAYWVAFLSKEEKEKIKHELDFKTTPIKLKEDISLIGKIDIYIECKNGRYRIVDYKTNKNNKFSNHTSQLSLYMLLLNRLHGIPYDQMDCEVIYLSMDESDKYGNPILNEGYENISKIYKLDELDVECLTSEIFQIDERIKKSIDTGKWKSNPTKFNCTYCDFKDICPEKWTEES